MASRLAWGMVALTLLFVVAEAVVIGQYLPLLSENAVATLGFPFIPGAVLGCAVMGALIISRHSRHVVGWLLSVVATVGAVSIALEAYTIWVQAYDGPGSPVLAGYAGWLSALGGGQIALMGISFIFFLVPDGHLPSPRWRFAVAVPALGGLLCILAIGTADPRYFSVAQDSGLAQSTNGVVLDIGFLLIIAGLLISLLGLLLRLARSHGEQRRQLRLIALAAGCVCTGLVWQVVGEVRNDGLQTWATSLPLFTSYLLLPISFAIAVLRYRLYDVEVIINRTLMVAAGTAFAGLGYTALVVGAGVVADRVNGQLWFSLAATAVVALAFQPARRTLLRLTQRLAFGPRSQPYEALSDFSARLALLPSPESLLTTVAEAAGQAVGARRATAGLHPLLSGAVGGAWGAPTSGQPEHEVPVSAHGVVIGRIGVTMPPGQPLRSSDRRLLDALAEQAGISFRNAAMQAELTRRVAELARTTEDLKRSRARLIQADDTVRRELSSAISQQVLPHLQAVQEQLDHRAGQTGREGGALVLETLVHQVNTALAALRGLTRGVHPTQLARLGLAPTIRGLLVRGGASAALHVDPSAADVRFSHRIEAAVYFCCVQALTSTADITYVRLRVDPPGTLVHTVAGVRPPGIDLTAIQDRAGAAGGRIEIDDQMLTLRFPVATPARVLASVAAQPLTSPQS